MECDYFEIPLNLQSNTNTLIKLKMGPYEANGIIRHRTQRLYGLQECLLKAGYNVEFILTPHLERFSVEFYGREIFRCNIKNFEFNLPCDEDVLCTKVMGVIAEHEGRFVKDANIPKFVSTSNGMRFLQRMKYYTTKDLISTSGTDLLFEIMKHVEPEAAEERVAIDYGDLELDGEDIERQKSKLSMTSSTMAQESERFDVTIPRKSSEGARSVGALGKSAQQLAEMLEDYDMPETNIFDRAKDIAKQRRAMFMFKSREIQPINYMTASAQQVMQAMKQQKAITEKKGGGGGGVGAEIHKDFSFTTMRSGGRRSIRVKMSS